MTSSEQIRKWYHQGVVLNHADRGMPGYEPKCDHRHPTVAFPRDGGVYNEPVHPFAHEAFEAYATTMRAMNVNMPGAGGVNACRNIGGTNTPSLHAYLCAIDLPPNSYKPTSFLVAIEDIRTNSGAQVFRTLNGDRMHDQIDCSPTALATGINWSTVDGNPGEDDMLPLTPTSAPEDIRSLQGRLNTAYGSGLTEDTIWGAKTSTAVKDNLLGFTGSDEAGDQEVLAGTKVNARMWNGLLVALIVSAVPQGEDGEDGQDGKDGDPGKKGDPGAKGDPGKDGKPVVLTITGDVALP